MACTSHSSYSGASWSGVVPRRGEPSGPVVGEPVPHSLGLVPAARVLDDHRVAVPAPGGTERLRVEPLVVGGTDENGRQLFGGGAAVRPGTIDVGGQADFVAHGHHHIARDYDTRIARVRVGALQERRSPDTVLQQ